MSSISSCVHHRILRMVVMAVLADDSPGVMMDQTDPDVHQDLCDVLRRALRWIARCRLRGRYRNDRDAEHFRESVQV